MRIPLKKEWILLEFKSKNVNIQTVVIAVLGVLFLIYNYYISIACIIIIGFLVLNERNEKTKNEQEWTQYVETLSFSMDHSTRQAITNLPIPLCICKTDGTITWYNKKFAAISMKKGLLGSSMNEVFPDIKIDIVASSLEMPSTFLDVGPKHYKIVYYIIPTSKNEKGIIMIYFLDETKYKNLLSEFENKKTSMMLIQIDSFDEVLSKVEDSMRPVMEAEVERLIKVWCENYYSAVIRTDKDGYAAVISEENLRAMEDTKFSILDSVRSLNYGNTLPVTLSIGVSSARENLIDTYESASSALELAQGRGGDQCVVKHEEKFTFYGGKSKAIEKRTRVKARIISYALKDLIMSSNKVFIMGHTFPDLDALGSSMGMYGICMQLGKKAAIVLEKSNSSIDLLYERIINNEKFGNIFINHEDALSISDENTLLIIVDTHKPALTECPELIDKIDKVVVIDHHRRGVEFVDKAVLVYHETYASSASEMVTEIIQYISENTNIDSLVAEALLAGITLDTKNFSFKTGVRTFEAAAFLRKLGADTVSVKMLFQGDIDTFMIIAETVKNSKIIDDKIAITYYSKPLTNSKLIASKAADELLNLKGVGASFVLTLNNSDEIQISARSLGKINVQIIMERLGGGGHMDTAAVQFKNISTEEAMDKLEDSVMEYLHEEGE